MDSSTPPCRILGDGTEMVRLLHTDRFKSDLISQRKLWLPLAWIFGVPFEECERRLAIRTNKAGAQRERNQIYLLILVKGYMHLVHPDILSNKSNKLLPERVLHHVEKPIRRFLPLVMKVDRQFLLEDFLDCRRSHLKSILGHRYPRLSKVCLSSAETSLHTRRSSASVANCSSSFIGANFIVLRVCSRRILLMCGSWKNGAVLRSQMTWMDVFCPQVTSHIC